MLSTAPFPREAAELNAPDVGCWLWRGSPKCWRRSPARARHVVRLPLSQCSIKISSASLPSAFRSPSLRGFAICSTCHGRVNRLGNFRSRVFGYRPSQPAEQRQHLRQVLSGDPRSALGPDGWFLNSRPVSGSGEPTWGALSPGSPSSRMHLAHNRPMRFWSRVGLARGRFRPRSDAAVCASTI